MNDVEFELRLYEKLLIKNEVAPEEREKEFNEWAEKDNIFIRMCMDCKNILGIRVDAVSHGVSHGICYKCLAKRGKGVKDSNFKEEIERDKMNQIEKNNEVVMFLKGVGK